MSKPASFSPYFEISKGYKKVDKPKYWAGLLFLAFMVNYDWMKNQRFVPILCMLIGANLSFGQTNFRTGWETSNPIAKDTDLSIEDKLSAHKNFLAKAQQEENPLREVYGHLYLTYDYLHLQNYASATEQVLKADSLAKQAGNPGWQGWVMHRKAIVSLRTKNCEDALKEYKESARLCGEAKDSLCMSESLEQVSIMYGYLNDFENAQRYHKIAMPLIEKYGGEVQQAAALNNFGNLQNWLNRNAEAVPYLERSVAIYQKLGKRLETVQAMNNLAAALHRSRQFDKAEKILQECIRINQENNFLENLRTNYGNLCVLYDSMGDYRKAFEYLDKYYSLNDSLIGAKTQQKIAELEIKYESQQKELELEKGRLALKTSRQTIERLIVLVLLVLLLAYPPGFWFWAPPPLHPTLVFPPANIVPVPQLFPPGRSSQ